MVPSDMTTNTAAIYKPDRDIGKRLFESGTFKDPRLLYDVSRATLDRHASPRASFKLGSSKKGESTATA